MALKSENITAICDVQNSTKFILEKLTYSNYHYANIAIAYSSLPDKEEKAKLEVDEYNAYTDRILLIEGFWSTFENNGYYISRSEAVKKFGKDNTDIIFSFAPKFIRTDLCVENDVLFFTGACGKYHVDVDGENIGFELTPTDKGYPFEATISNQKYAIFWNWTNDERDFCYYMWSLADDLGYIQRSKETFETIRDYSCFECYDQARLDMPGPDESIMSVFELLQNAGYLHIYYIMPENQDFIWDLRTPHDNRIGMMLLNEEFENNLEIVNKIEAILNASEK